ncbi:MAG: 2-hydroxychromene-2-carboxylate isomerase [Flavobacterium sp.]|jgi:2-hydroxychromene-2-carboxylate isomerase
MSPQINFYWDLGSTNSYFAIKLIEPIAKKYGAKINWHPFNVGHVFQSNNYVLMDEPRAKLKNRRDDLMRWAKKYDLPFSVPAAFPIKTSRALRGAIAMRQWGKEADFINEIFAAYWERGDGSIGDYETLRDIASKLDVDPQEFEVCSESEPVRQALIDSTNKALDKGVFGVPSIQIGEALYWGKDRMEFVEEHLSSL